MKKRKFISLLIILVISFTTIFRVDAQFSDVPPGIEYEDALNNLAELGIISTNLNGLFRPNDILTREEFATMMVISAGFGDIAAALKGSTVFPDVAPDRWSNGYINVAANEGFIRGMSDGKFHPNESISFAKACAIMVLALGYTAQDVPGFWPNNYIAKAKSLGLIEGINLKSDNELPRWAAAVMVDRILTTQIKSSNTETTSKTFSEVSGRFIECIILGNSLTTDNILYNQILTDKGIFYLNNSSLKIKPGNTYILDMDEDKVKAAYNIKTVENISVDSIVNTRISFKIGDNVNYRTLSDKTVYYYKGIKQNYDNLKNIIQTRSSIVFTLNRDKSGYEYAVIFDPVFSKPQIADLNTYYSYKSGTLDLKDFQTIIKNGDTIEVSSITNLDAVYKITDIWGNHPYIFVSSDRPYGYIKGFTPSRLSPSTIQIDFYNTETKKIETHSYEVSDDFDISILAPNNFKIGEYVYLVLGYDGKVVSISY